MPWTATGSSLKGPKGDQGIQGSAGAQGDPGATGPAGSDGADATRFNLCPNPTSETNVTGFAGSSMSVARSTATFYSGTGGALFTGTATATGTAFCPAGPGVEPGRVYTVSAWVRRSASAAVTPFLLWYDAAGTQMSQQVSAPAVTVGTTWTRVLVTGVAPAGAAQLRLAVQTAVTTSITLGVEDILYEQAPVPRPYFDGSNPSARWSGTAHGSASEWVPGRSPVVSLSPSAAQSIPHNTATAVLFGAEAFDTHDGHSVSSLTSRWTCPVGWDGYYWASGSVLYESNPAGGGVAGWLAVNGTRIVATPIRMDPPDDGLGIGYSVTPKLIYLAAGQYVELFTLHFGGAVQARSLYYNAGSPGDRSSMELMWVRAA